MTKKELAKNVIDTLPKSATFDDIIHALYVNAKFTHGERQIAESKGIPHEKAKTRLKKWVK